MPTDLDYFNGHFRTQPILPGIVQILWAVEFGRTLLSVRGDFKSLAGLKFMRLIQPGESLILHLNYQADAHELYFEYQSAGNSCSLGTARYTIGPIDSARPSVQAPR